MIRMNYLRFLPEGLHAGGEKEWPLILFLHGAGERGNDPDIVKRNGIPKIVENRPDFPFIALSPQCNAGASWEVYIDTLVAFLEDAVRTLPVDMDRIYLTGISLGGNGVWRLGVERPDRFAAIAPICGFGKSSQGFPARVCALKDTPVWVFHGGKDDVVPLGESRILVETLKACGGDVRFTIYPDAGHDSWTRTYDDPALYEWFLMHKLKRISNIEHRTAE